MFLGYSDFLNESVDPVIIKAKKLANNKQLAKVLNECEEGIYTWISVIRTRGAKSYVGVALNDGNAISYVYDISDPRVALVALILDNSKNNNPEEIISMLTNKDELLNYAIFAGNKSLSPEEISKRFNFQFKTSATDNTVMRTNTPVIKLF